MKSCCCWPRRRTIRGFAGRQLDDPVAATQSDLDQAAKKSFDELRAAQKADHEKWFNRVELNLPATANSALPTDRAAGGLLPRARRIPRWRRCISISAATC